MQLAKGFALGVLLVLSAIALTLVLPFAAYVLGAILLAYVLAPLQARLAPKLGPRTAALSLMLGALLAFVIPLVLIIRVAVIEAMQILSRIESGELDMFVVDRWVEGVLGRSIDTSLWADRVQEALFSAVQSSEGGFAAYLTDAASVIGGFTELVIGLTLFAFLLYYLLKDGPALVAWIRRVTPLPRAMQAELHRTTDRLLWAILIGNLLVSVIQGLLTGFGLAVAGFSNVVFWTVMTTFFALLPLIGASVVWVPASLYLFATGQFITGAFLAIFGTFVISLSDNFLRGIIGGRSARMNPGLFTLGIFGGLVAFGFVGIFIGPLVVGMLQAFVEVFAREYNPYYAEAEFPRPTETVQPTDDSDPAAGAERPS
ncbi:AI-2E family transporter [Haloferacaceae archaeon DSL9]